MSQDENLAAVVSTVASHAASDIGSFIRAQREAAQVSVRQLAEKAGVSNPYLSQIERGLRKPSAEVLNQIAKALRVSAEVLYVQAGILEPSESNAVRDAIVTDMAISERVRQAARAAGEAAKLMQDPVEPVRPACLEAARDGAADDLKRIKGVGPKLEELLNSLGYYHFDQIAAWSAAEVAWIDAHLEGFHGRATRDEWVAQAKLLAAGEETEFSKRADKGATD